jgi:hypothetical protein
MKPIKPGRYERADSRAIGDQITAWNMSVGETNVRCLGADGFFGLDTGNGTFVITVAPEGYRDTLGRKFKSQKL